MQTQKTFIPYRPDIDGLRAIAVLAVIFYHLDIPYISGGFVGVDIFFVISGFLISGIIYSEIKSERFSLVNFYIRRIRRIFPALFFIVFVTAIAALFMLPHLQLQEFSESIISVAWFVSNIFFWLHDDYFSVAAELKPLLHTWSLSVEEQFYVFFPLAMLILNKSRIHLMNGVLLLILLLSFILSLLLSDGYNSANFYLAPTRAWEFLFGTMLALGLLPEVKHKIIRQWLSLLGLGLILSSIVMLSDQSVFPGVNAIYPALGALLVIYSGATRSESYQTLVSVVLSTAVLRYIGLISYSLYLWHWPIIALLKNHTSGEFGIVIKVGILFAVFILSAITYQFVERPFRKQPALMARISLKTGLIAIVIMSIMGGGLYYYSSRISVPENLQTRQEVLESVAQLETCFLEEETLQSVSRCSFGDKTSDKIFLFWGDSHTLAMYPAFVKLAEDSGWRGIHASLTGCPPLLDVTVEDVKHCDGSVAQHVKTFLLNNKVDTIFLVSRWNLYETGWLRNGRLMKPNSFVSDKETRGVDAKSSTQVLHKAMGRTIHFLTREAEKSVNILLPVPVLPKLIDEYAPETKGVVTKKDYLGQRASIEQRLNDFKSNPLLKIIDPITVLCPNKNCKLFDKGSPMYLDDNHLSPVAAMMLLPLLEEVLQEKN